MKKIIILLSLSFLIGQDLHFTTCGQTGWMGPSQEQCDTTYDEGFVEACHHASLPLIAVMWHPERNPDENSIQLFQRIFSLEN